MQLKLIDQGRTAEIFDLGDNRVLKLFRKNIPFPAIENEFNNSGLVSKYNLPVPEFYGKYSYSDRTGLVYEYVHGKSMLKHFLHKPWFFFIYAKKMADIHARLHSSEDETLVDQKVCLESFIKRSKELSDTDKQKIIIYLKKLEPGKRICHGDMHPDNILYAERGPVVIDWMGATKGNPAGDVAKTILILKHSKVPSSVPFYKRIISNMIKSLFCNVYTRQYIRLTGIKRKEIDQWILPEAAARLSEHGPQDEKRALKKLIKKELIKI